MKQVKISELPEAQSLERLWVMATDSDNKSVKVSMETIINAAVQASQAVQQSEI